jgi:hypothetical protein
MRTCLEIPNIPGRGANVRGIVFVPFSVPQTARITPFDAHDSVLQMRGYLELGNMLNIRPTGLQMQKYLQPINMLNRPAGQT